MEKIIFITGGARSGKSTFAEKLAKDSKRRIAYIATSIPFDDGMKNRIEKHKRQRPKEWKTIEKYEDFHQIESMEEFNNSDILLVDCITVMVNNLMFYSDLDFDECAIGDVNQLERYIMKQVEELLDLSFKKDMIIVSNEVGMGLVPAYKMGSYYRDIAGRINQMIASRADEAYFIVSGLKIKIK